MLNLPSPEEMKRAIDAAFNLGRRHPIDTSLWTFKGMAGVETSFEVTIKGRLSSRALANVIKQLELYRQFVAEDEATFPAESSVEVRAMKGERTLPSPYEPNQGSGETS